MASTDQFRDQHDRLLEFAHQLREQLDPEAIAKDARTIRHDLGRFLGTLRVHLAMEDEVLYPGLLEHDDPVVREAARRFVDEMGGIAQRVGDYSSMWKSETAIAADAPGFVRDTSAILTALGERIQRENAELYPLVDARDP